jgi:uncharacterized protein YkwD
MHAHVRAALVAAATSAAATLAVMVFTATAGAAATGAKIDRVERKVVRLINRRRGAHGLASLRISRSLNRSAAFHTGDMLRHDFFAHWSSDGRTMSHRVSDFRPSRQIGENLAYVRRGGPSRVVRMWMASPTHRAMILFPGFRRIGVARRHGKLGTIRAMVFTADFATRR